MPEQFSLPGFDAQPPQLPPPPKRGLSRPWPRSTLPTQRLFLALFPEAHDAARIAELIDALRQRHRLSGQRLHTDRLHITLHSLGDYVDAVPQTLIDGALAAAATVVHPPLDIVFDHALSFAGGNASKNAFVLSGHDTAAVSQLGGTLGLALKRAGLRSQPSRKPHMTMLYNGRVIEERAFEPIRWTATEFVLVLSHLGKTHHQWLARWPLTGTR
jgi:RNA 2',3'-cyclic 3'-phosphodiesterase